MYRPPYYAVTDQEEMISFMRHHPFALLICADGDDPIATHLPLEVEAREDALYLSGHFARSNPQGAMLEQGSKRVLAVFQGAHAYVSSSWYAKPSVPTWNYLALHAYGQAHLVTSAARITEMMQSLLGRFEQGQKKPVTWGAIPADHMAGLLAGITCFEIRVERIEASYKLSQNRSDEDREAIMLRLLAGGEKEREVARAMRAVKQAQANLVFTKTSR